MGGSLEEGGLGWPATKGRQARPSPELPCPIPRLARGYGKTEYIARTRKQDRSRTPILNAGAALLEEELVCVCVCMLRPPGGMPP